MNIDSSVARRSQISTYIVQGVTDSRVVDALVRGGLAISDEAAVWDFKRELPVRPAEKLNTTLSADYDAKFAEIVRDAVSFYNSYGGYLIAGIDDATRVVVGFEKSFDAADLNKRIQGATEHSIETIFRTVSIAISTKELSVGLLLIPKRPPHIRPAQFKKFAPKSNIGKVAYEQNDVYFRERDNSKKAVKTEELEFLFGSRSIELAVDMGRAIENNLPQGTSSYHNLSDEIKSYINYGYGSETHSVELKF
jgi:Schlafen, AlbA_2